MKNRGFTLVELSIVLVIIGLLIGGILVGQSLIQAAQIQSFIRQIQQYDIAVSNFRNKLKCLPGDCAKLSPQGNGDGIITSGPLPLSAGSDDYFAYEYAYFWNHLTTLKFINDGKIYSNDPAIGPRTGITIPKSIIGNKNSGIIMAYANNYDSSNDYADWYGKNFYHIYDQIAIAPWGVLVGENSIRSIDVQSIDAKIDDGAPLIGDVRAAGKTENSSILSPECVTGSKYNLTNTVEYGCSMAILLLSQTGEKQ